MSLNETQSRTQQSASEGDTALRENHEVQVNALTSEPGTTVADVSVSTAEILRSALMDGNGYDFDREDTIPLEGAKGSEVHNNERAEGEDDQTPLQLVEVDMVSVADSGSAATTTGASIIPAGRSQSGKRKMWQNLVDSSKGDDTAIQTRSKLRRNNGGRRESKDDGQAFRKNPTNVEEATDAMSQSEADASKKASSKGARKKAPREKKETITPKLRDVPADVEQLAEAPSAEIGASAIEWIEDIESIRKGSSNIQGGLSGQIRKRVVALKTTVRLLMEKAAEQGDPAYLRRRNQELACDLRVAEQEIKKLKTTVKDL